MNLNFFKKRKHEEPDLTDSDNALHYLLTESPLHNGLETEYHIEENKIYCPKWDLTITPELGQLTTQNAVVHFHIHAPKWGKDLFECSAAIGESTRQALDISCVSFLSTFIDGIAKMENKDFHETLETTFGGKKHRWNVSLSNIVGIGNASTAETAEFYWNTLKESILKRLGNQKMCYVKVYLAKSHETITAECRIDDIKSEELSSEITKIAEKWTVNPFASQKIFFFIQQDEETILPYAYSGNEGSNLLKSKVKTAISLFHACKTQEQYEQFPKQLKQALDDATLASECYSFLPEMCTENAFPQMTYAESIQIIQNNKSPITYYKSQLADYFPIYAALFSLFEEGAFGDDVNEIYQKYIRLSATYNVIQQIHEKGGNNALEHGVLSALLYRMEDDFEIR